MSASFDLAPAAVVPPLRGSWRRSAGKEAAVVPPVAAIPDDPASWTPDQAVTALYTAGWQPLVRLATMLTGDASVAVVYLPIYALFLPHRIMDAPIGPIITQTIYQGIFVSIISLYAYARAVSILGASLGSSFASLVPVLAMLAAIPLLGEWPRGSDYVGIAAITFGVFLSSGAYQALLPQKK